MTKPTLSDKDWQDYDLSIQYIESLSLRTIEDFDNALRSLKSDLRDIELQLRIEGLASQKYADKSEYEEWKLSALKALRVKNRHIEWLRSHRAKVDKSEDAKIRAICYNLSDFILSLPAGVQVPSEVMRDLIFVQNCINYRQKKE